MKVFVLVKKLTREWAMHKHIHGLYKILSTWNSLISIERWNQYNWRKENAPLRTDICPGGKRMRANLGRKSGKQHLWKGSTDFRMWDSGHNCRKCVSYLGSLISFLSLWDTAGVRCTDRQWQMGSWCLGKWKLRDTKLTYRQDSNPSRRLHSLLSWIMLLFSVISNNSLTRIFLQFQMTFHLFIAAFVGAAATLVSLVSCFKIILENKWSRYSVSGIRLRLERYSFQLLKLEGSSEKGQQGVWLHISAMGCPDTDKSIEPSVNRICCIPGSCIV